MEPRKRVDVVRLELNRVSSLMPPYRKLNSPGKVVKLVRDYIGNVSTEYFIAIALNVKLEPTAITVISKGGLSSSTVSISEVVKFGLLANAASIILSHNHPSGDPEPSQEDLNVTRNIAKLCRTFGITVQDHVILGEETYVSLKEDSYDF